MRAFTFLPFGVVFVIFSSLVYANSHTGGASPEDILFETDPTAAVSGATGLDANGVTAAQPRADGGAVVESAASLTTPEGRVLENIADAEIDGSGNVLRAGQLEFEGSSFHQVSGFRPTLGGFFAKAADELTTDKYLLTGGMGIRYQNSKLKAQSARSFGYKSAVTINLQALDATAEQFSLASADSITRGCAVLKNLKDATIVVRRNEIEARPHTEEAVQAVDCSHAQASFVGSNSYVALTTEKPTHYAIGPGRISFDAGNETHTIETESSATVDVEDGAGISCMHLGPASIYWFNADDLVRDFGIQIPETGSDYQLCLRKRVEQAFEGTDGLVDFVNRTIELKGIVTYLRLPVENGQPASLIMDRVYQSFDRNNIATITLDADFFGINSIEIENQKPGTGTLSLVNNGHYAVYEYGTGSEVRRYGHFNERRFADLVSKYSSRFGASTPDVLFQDNLLIQEGNNALGSATKVVAVCDSCAAKRDFEKQMAKLEHAFPLSAARCGT